MTVPYTFATQTGNIPLNELDTNFSTLNAAIGNINYSNTAGTAGTVTANAQANITSVGTLTELTVSGNITGNYILGNASQLSGLPLSPINIVTNINAGNSIIQAGTKAYITVPTNGTITGWTVLGNNQGDIQFTVALTNFATFPAATTISGGEVPALASEYSNRSSTLSGWTTALSAGDILEVGVVGTPTMVTLATLTLSVQPT
jgi:hypothetical protein